MYRLFILPVILQIICIVHLIRNGRERYYWIYIIIFIPAAGSIAYLIIEILVPALKNSKSREISSTLSKSIFADKRIKQLEQKAEFSPTFSNKVSLAHEYYNCGFFEKAITAYKNCLDNAFDDEPDIKLKLAQAYFKTEKYDQAKAILSELKNNKNFIKHSAVWLTYIQVLEKLNDNESALNEYEKYIIAYSDFESLCRYGLFLKKTGRTDKAKNQFSRILTESQHSPKYSIRDHRQWIRRARMELKNTG